MAKLIIVDGLDDLKLLENQSAKLKFKLFVPSAEIKTKNPMLIWTTRAGTNMVVIGTVGYVAVAKMTPGEPVPIDAIRATYLKI